MQTYAAIVTNSVRNLKRGHFHLIPVDASESGSMVCEFFGPVVPSWFKSYSRPIIIPPSMFTTCPVA